jgi:hypothetical protein
MGLYLLLWPFFHFFGKNWQCERCGNARNLTKTRRRPY